MLRLGATIVAASMFLIAVSFGAVLYLGAGLAMPGAIVCAIAALTGLVVAATVMRRRAGTVPDRTGDMTRVMDFSRQIADLGRRISAMETKVSDAVARAEAATEPLSLEIGEIGVLIKQIAESVNAHDLALQDGGVLMQGVGAASPPPPQPAIHIPEPVAEPAPSPTRPASERAEPVLRRREAAGTSLKILSPAAAAGIVAEAVAANRIEFHLQPILTLPQRKVRFYEALARLRTAGGELLTARDFLETAEAGRLMPRIDNQMLFRCVKVVRRLMAKSRGVGLFCNISAATLADDVFFAQFAEYMEVNRAIAPALVFEFTQAAYRAFGPIENESLATLAGAGFRFSLDNVGDLKIEPRDLADRGFRFVKVPAALLLDRAPAGGVDIHAADLSSLLTRFGLELIVDKIESEATVIDLLDYDVKYGQGNLFSPPRPVRAEVLQGSEAADETRAESASGPSAAAVGQSAAPVTARRADVPTRGLAQIASVAVARAGH